jgi:hypothetical protein
LVSGLVHVVRDKTGFFQSIDELFGHEFAGLGTEFFTDGHTNSRRGVGHDKLRGIVKLLHDFVNEAHLFNCIEGASDQALAASQAGIFADRMNNTQAAGDGVNRADLAAGIATDAIVFVDLDHAAQFTATKIANVFRSVFPMRIGRRGKRIDQYRFGHV